VRATAIKDLAQFREHLLLFPALGGEGVVLLVVIGIAVAPCSLGRTKGRCGATRPCVALLAEEGHGGGQRIGLLLVKVCDPAWLCGGFSYLV
jgi:hypothetical protein